MPVPASYRPLIRELGNLASPAWWRRPPGGPRKLWGVFTMLAHNVWLRAANGLARRLGAPPRVTCPICGFSGRAFLTGLRSNWRLRFARECPTCHSRQRHRFLWLLLKDRYDAPDWAGVLLHFSPRGCLPRAVFPPHSLHYLAADLDPAGADVCLDITSLPFRDAAVAHAICSHVLEHVPDDRAALAELSRVLAPDGAAFICVPLFGDTTEEFGAADSHTHEHVRAYGHDLHERLTDCFDVTAHEVGAEYDEEAVRRCGLLPGEVVYCCRPLPTGPRRRQPDAAHSAPAPAQP